MTNTSRAIADVIAERHRQIDVEGHTYDRDDNLCAHQLELAGATYALAAADRFRTIGSPWPWRSERFKRTSPRRMLVKSAALIIAAIERIDRNEKSS